MARPEASNDILATGLVSELTGVAGKHGTGSGLTAGKHGQQPNVFREEQAHGE